MNDEKKLQTSLNLCVDDIVKRETVKVKRAHRRNSSLNMQISNRAQWLQGCFIRFKEFVNELSKNSPYEEKFKLWMGKITTLNMMYLSILSTSEFVPVLDSIKNGDNDTKEKINYAINKLCIYFDIDTDYIKEEDYDKLCRYMCLFCQSCIEDN